MLHGLPCNLHFYQLFLPNWKQRLIMLGTLYCQLREIWRAIHFLSTGCENKPQAISLTLRAQFNCLNIGCGLFWPTSSFWVQHPFEPTWYLPALFSCHRYSRTSQVALDTCAWVAESPRTPLG